MKFNFVRIGILGILYFLYRFYHFINSHNNSISNCLLLIAHPDDESMFFSPFLYWNKPFILCLSDGNFEGKGITRRSEFSALCQKREIKYKILSYEDNSDWKTDEILLDVLNLCEDLRIENLVTFDSGGVSGHKNHVACFKAIKKLETFDSGKIMRYRYLKTVNLFEKYSVFLHRADYTVPLFSKFGYENMKFHKSQLLWFRYIYIIFSSYMQYNSFS